MTPLNLEAQCQLATKTNIQRLYITDDANGVVFFFISFVCFLFVAVVWVCDRVRVEWEATLC